MTLPHTDLRHKEEARIVGAIRVVQESGKSKKGKEVVDQSEGVEDPVLSHQKYEQAK